MGFSAANSARHGVNSWRSPARPGQVIVPEGHTTIDAKSAGRRSRNPKVKGRGPEEGRVPKSLKSEARNPKPEGRKKAEGRIPKTETRGRARFGRRASDFGLRSTVDLRPSAFGLLSANPPLFDASASYWRGAPFDCLAAWAQGRCEAVVSPALLAEREA